jgi:hypothetical protein
MHFYDIITAENVGTTKCPNHVGNHYSCKISIKKINIEISETINLSISDMPR